MNELATALCNCKRQIIYLNMKAMDKQTSGQTDKQTNWWTKKQRNKETEERINEQTYKPWNKPINGLMTKWTDK